MSAVAIEQWRQAGAKEAVGVLSGEALRQCLQAAFGGRPGIQVDSEGPEGKSSTPACPPSCLAFPNSLFRFDRTKKHVPKNIVPLLKNIHIVGRSTATA